VLRTERADEIIVSRTACCHHFDTIERGELNSKEANTGW
jgi:hypothetical protein